MYWKSNVTNFKETMDTLMKWYNIEIREHQSRDFEKT